MNKIVQAALRNPYYRHVVSTTARYQLALMSIPAGEDIGAESHSQKQTIVIIRGRARSLVSGKRRNLREGDTLVVPPRARHNVVNTGRGALKLFTIYEPPAHRPGVIQKKKPH